MLSGWGSCACFVMLMSSPENPSDCCNQSNGGENTAPLQSAYSNETHKGSQEYLHQNRIDGCLCSKNSCLVPGIYVSLPTGFQRVTPLQDVAKQIIYIAGTPEIVISKVIRYRPIVRARVAEIITIKRRCRRGRYPDYEHKGIQTKLNPDEPRKEFECIRGTCGQQKIYQDNECKYTL